MGGISAIVCGFFVNVVGTKITARDAKADTTKDSVTKLTKAITVNPRIPLETKINLLENQEHTLPPAANINDLVTAKALLDSRREKYETENTLRTMRDEKARRDQLEASRQSLMPFRPIFDQAIRLLENKLSLLAKEQGDSVLSTYEGIPSPMNPDTSNICTMHFVRRSNLTFRVGLMGPSSSSGTESTRLMILANNNIQLELKYPLDQKGEIQSRKAGSVYTILSGPKMDPIVMSASGEDSNATIDSAITLLIAAADKAADH